MIYLDNNTFQQEIFIPRSSVKNDASPEYATKNELENAIENEVIRADEKYAAKTDLLPYATTGWVESQDFATKEWTDGQIQSAIASETGRTEETYQKKSEMGIYSTTNEVENMIDDAVSGKMDTSAMSAYTKTENFATINGSAITEGGNIVIEGGGSDYSAGSNINIDENNVISVTGITVPTSNTAFTNDAGYVTSGEVETQITDKNYATENWVQDNVNLAIESETARTESTYAKIGDIPSLDGYATTGWVESQGYLKEHQDISGKLDTDTFTAYTANTQTELNNKQDASAMTAYYTSAQTDTAIQNATNGLASEEWVESQGYLTGYTETDPVFMASAASGITSQDITNWNNKLDSSDLEPYYTSAQTDNAINNAVSGKADLSAVTAQISEVKQEIEAEIPSKVSSLENDLNFVNSGDVKTQVESYNYINSVQAQTQIDNSISGKLDTDAFTTYTANTQTELNNKQDISGMTEYATTAFTESTYAKIGDIPTKTSDLTNDSGFITDAALSGYATEQYVDNSVSGKVDNSALTQYYTSAQTDTAISNAVSGKLDTSAITAYSTTEEVENMITAATYGLASEEWVNNQGFLKEHQDISGKLDTSVFTTYTANTKTEIDNKQDASAMTEYATTAFTEQTYLKEHQSLSAYTPTSGFSTINGSAITEGGNIVVEETPYSGGTNIDITDHVISVTGISVPTKLSELTNDEGFVNSGEVETQITSKGYITGYTETDPVFQASAASGITSQDISNWNNKLDSSALTPYYTSAQTDTAISSAISGKMDTSAMSAYTKTEGFATINGSAITEGGNIEIQGGSSIENYQPLQVEFDPSYSFIDAYEINSVGKQQFYKRIAFDTINGNSIIHQSDNDKVNWTIPTSTSALTNDSGYVTSGEVNTQIESKGYITDADLNGYATTAFTEQTYLKEHQSLSAYTPTSGFSTINGRSITEGGNIVIQGGGSGSDYIAGANIEITADNVINVTGITVPTKLSELTNDAGYITTETDPIFMASPASGISEQDITNWDSKLDASSLEPYYTSAQTDTAIDNAVSGKQDTLVSGVNIKTINNESLLGSGNIVIQGGSGGGSNIIELTQAEYDALTAYTEDALYVITDSQAINMDKYVTTGALGSYYTSAETDTAILNAVSGKTDKVSVTANSSGYKFPTWNNQGCITGTSATAYQASQSINGSSRTLYSNSSSSLPTIYAPTSAGSAGQPLLSNGSGAPVWASYKFQFISQSQYDALATKDSTTIYFIVNEN